MKRFDQLSYTDRIKWRVRALWALLMVMLIYMFVVGETGGGDSRIMTGLAQATSRIIFFGGFLYIITRIVHAKKLLKNRLLLKEEMRDKQDERNQYLHDKSGGIVMDILLFLLLFVTVTAALYNMPAFYVSLGILAAAILLKVSAYLIYSRM